MLGLIAQVHLREFTMQGVKDWHMVVMVVLITGVVIILLAISTAFLRPNLALLYSEEYRSAKGVCLYVNQSLY